ncbi:zinc-binding dehydrogenase [Saccharothrix violaceirubra]|uniref:NADPH2:quinone reductase n=1 Tax=Saccharothrix violaceirubra TaxID=413306 RepID=A0A7W7WVP9_9PSEU|nr:zinc-binding dehydrogenase [Saccharothrix violaceirubra]MBB4965569.1 NADPH2:quinone reductase [Saccharothrix violaceirubra]
MRAFLLREYGGTPELDVIDEPLPGPGQVLAEVLAAGVNPVDLAIADGQLGTAHPLPRVLGNEAVVLLGDRVGYSQRTSGSFADRTLVDPAGVLDVPSALDPTAVFAAGISGQPAWIPLETTAALRPGETVLVLGATGAAGQVAVQAARLLGAGRVVAAAGHRPTLTALLDRGADEVVVLGGPDDAAALLEATRGGADVVYDPLWGAPFSAALRATRPGGRTVTVGRSAGEHVAAIPVFDFLGRTMLSYRNGGASPDVVARAFGRMLRHVAAGELVVDTSVFPLSAAADAWAHQKSVPHGKVVLGTA